MADGASRQAALCYRSSYRTGNPLLAGQAVSPAIINGRSHSGTGREVGAGFPIDSSVNLWFRSVRLLAASVFWLAKQHAAGPIRYSP